jgi:3-phosphoshikimate 1-carboxyvinyltransferase
MALAVAALTSENGVTIENAESVSKSFPTFFEKLKEIGGNIDE